MSAGTQDRLLAFEIGSSLFALPIEGVHEVAEMVELACIPTLPRDVAGVINYRGDALPVVRRERLLTPGEGALDAPEHVLVISDRPSSPPCLGLNVDRVLGLVDGKPAASSRGGLRPPAVSLGDEVARRVSAQRGEAERRAADRRDVDPVVEKRPMSGRVAHILDPTRLVARARKVIEDALARGE